MRVSLLEQRRRRMLAERVVLAVANAAGVMPDTLRIKSQRPYVVELRRIVTILGIEKNLPCTLLSDTLGVAYTTISRLSRSGPRHMAPHHFDQILNQARRAL